MISEIYKTILEKLQINSDNICRYAYPLARYMHEIHPDYIIVLDCGARITGFVIHQLYSKLYGELPSVDHSMHFIL